MSFHTPSQPPVKRWHRRDVPHKPKPAPSNNLRRYLREAALVPFRSSGVPKSSLVLSIEPDPRHKLRKITVLQLIPMENKIKNFVNKQVPHLPVLRVSEFVAAGIRLPAPSFNVSPLKHPKSLRIDQVEPPRVPAWLIRQVAVCLRPVLATAANITALIWPQETSKFGIREFPPINSFLFDGPPESDFSLAKFYAWGQDMDPDAPFGDKPIKVVIMTISLITLDESELREFMNMGTFPAFELPGRNVADPTNENPPPTLPKRNYTRAQKVWAKLWEECARVNCPYFIVTNYQNWVFGAFTNGWTKALCSPLIRQEATQATVLQWMVFWYGTSMQLPGAWSLPVALLDLDHPDYGHRSKIAEKFLPEARGKGEERRAADIKWLETTQSYNEPGDGNTREILGLANTWYTSFT
ncbi:hypothetical protein BU17DRAFT_95877 [Hysterangium stoloniferum]|nr:hypothetical protein BU17DRAFT_95877 [Hysterangium stoloniferum]